ncbi:phosphatidylglycerol lysyltransferase domain-containing protein, partial [Frankia sp. AgKG'84/4]|uniref:phosphatidylglycerol lysyltransferase domain-containing protein n=1 Tax=Frankia sp. AgKG'84/4 TaxID=573490 RepID=UPI00202ABBA4
ALSGAAVLLDLARGLAVIPALVDLVPFTVLLATRQHFHAAGDPRTRWRALGALAALGAADLLIGLTLIRFRHGRGGATDQVLHILAGLIGISGPVRFGPGDGNLVASVLLALGVVTVGVTGYLALRPARPVAALAGDDCARLRALLTRHGGRDSLSYAALRRDNSVLWSPTGKAAITYRVVGGVALACGDPIGDPEAWPGVIGPFLELAAAHAWVPAAVGCGPDGGRAWQRAGLRVLELGDEAVVCPGEFCLDSPPMHGVRQAVDQVERAGHTARIDRIGDLTDDDRATLAERASAWRARGAIRG